MCCTSSPRPSRPSSRAPPASCSRTWSPRCSSRTTRIAPTPPPCSSTRSSPRSTRRSPPSSPSSRSTATPRPPRPPRRPLLPPPIPSLCPHLRKNKKIGFLMIDCFFFFFSFLLLLLLLLL